MLLATEVSLPCYDEAFELLLRAANEAVFWESRDATAAGRGADLFLPSAAAAPARTAVAHALRLRAELLFLLRPFGAAVHVVCGRETAAEQTAAQSHSHGSEASACAQEDGATSTSVVMTTSVATSVVTAPEVTAPDIDIDPLPPKRYVMDLKYASCNYEIPRE